MVELTPEQKQARLQKQIEMVETVYNAAMSIMDEMQAFPPKRIFRGVNRRPKKRKQAIDRIKQTAFGTGIELQKIIATPMPHYPNGGIAIVDENAPELINWALHNDD